MKLTELEVNEYQVGGGGPQDMNNITIQRRRQLEGPDLWALYNGSWCVNKQGRLTFEPMPSGRTEEWIENHRFESAEAALACYLQNTQHIWRVQYAPTEVSGLE